jgi:hypothetical protein
MRRAERKEGSDRADRGTGQEMTTADQRMESVHAHSPALVMSSTLKATRHTAVEIDASGLAAFSGPCARHASRSNEEFDRG